MHVMRAITPMDPASGTRERQSRSRPAKSRTLSLEGTLDESAPLRAGALRDCAHTTVMKPSQERSETERKYAFVCTRSPLSSPTHFAASFSRWGTL